MLDKMAAKIRQIAEIARVSPATVSLALNNKPGVSPATRARVLGIRVRIGLPAARTTRAHRQTDPQEAGGDGE